ncbi:2'-deoxymugineic-acid 2'-dioxygenase-like [Impatiens glandulifera]|uniref:2'-deoxymugineic-acid 2'-dioxygenase-like n=1 Tax=Impatiens glandulifera TaxID=253017 RepID=UPI001FB073FB|nr:2'-deoxymugineic-acid 2'-dioxygenase-like [Impatiens glandulifera]
MAKLISSWAGGHNQDLPEHYILPPHERPGDLINVLPCDSIPVIDLGKVLSDGGDRTNIIQQILNASREFGFFQVINHGVSESLMDDAMRLFNEFFELPGEDKEYIYSEDSRKSCRVFTGSDYQIGPTQFWRDTLRHPCFPLEDSIQSWPIKPDRYRDIVSKYSVEVRKLSLKILELISIGLGMDEGYFGEEFIQIQNISVNHYPPCPNPRLTLGIRNHCDPNLITILQQGDVQGLQVFKDGNWIGVRPVPYSFVVNMGNLLQVISNGKLRSVEHRAVTNSECARTSIATFLMPSFDYCVEPAKSLVSESYPPIFKPFKYMEFIREYLSNTDNPQAVLDHFKL